VTVAGGIPADWIWVTDTTGPYEAAFPTAPARVDQAEQATSADGRPIASRRWQSIRGDAGFVLYRTPEPPGAIASAGGPARFSERVAKSTTNHLGAQLADVRTWAALDGGWAARLKVGEREGELRIGVDGDVLYVLQVLGAPPEAATAFLDAVRPLEAVVPVRVALPGGAAVECPSRCGLLADRLLVAGRPVPLAGVRGQLDQDRFEAVAVPVGDLDRDAIVAALTDRAASHGARREGETPIDGGVEVRFGAQTGVGVARIVDRGDAIVAVEVIAPFGRLPSWTERYLDSAR
jgi:hypothetical protein